MQDDVQQGGRTACEMEAQGSQAMATEATMAGPPMWPGAAAAGWDAVAGRGDVDLPEGWLERLDPMYGRT